MANFGLIKSFDIDDGQLDPLSKQQCFVLGYELSQLDEQLKLSDAFSRLVHADNRLRIEKSCEDANRSYSLQWMKGDKSESWLMLKVDPKDV